MNNFNNFNQGGQQGPPNHFPFFDPSIPPPSIQQSLMPMPGSTGSGQQPSINIFFNRTLHQEQNRTLNVMARVPSYMQNPVGNFPQGQNFSGNYQWCSGSSPHPGPTTPSLEENLKLVPYQSSGHGYQQFGMPQHQTSSVQQDPGTQWTQNPGIIPFKQQEVNPQWCQSASGQPSMSQNYPQGHPCDGNQQSVGHQPQWCQPASRQPSVSQNHLQGHPSDFNQQSVGPQPQWCQPASEQPSMFQNFPQGHPSNVHQAVSGFVAQGNSKKRAKLTESQRLQADLPPYLKEAKGKSRLKKCHSAPKSGLQTISIEQKELTSSSDSETEGDEHSDEVELASKQNKVSRKVFDNTSNNNISGLSSKAAGNQATVAASGDSEDEDGEDSEEESILMEIPSKQNGGAKAMNLNCKIDFPGRSSKARKGEVNDTQPLATPSHDSDEEGCEGSEEACVTVELPPKKKGPKKAKTLDSKINLTCSSAKTRKGKGTSTQPLAAVSLESDEAGDPAFVNVQPANPKPKRTVAQKTLNDLNMPGCSTTGNGKKSFRQTATVPRVDLKGEGNLTSMKELPVKPQLKKKTVKKGINANSVKNNLPGSSTTASKGKRHTKQSEIAENFYLEEDSDDDFERAPLPKQVKTGKKKLPLSGLEKDLADVYGKKKNGKRVMISEENDQESDPDEPDDIGDNESGTDEGGDNSGQLAAKPRSKLSLRKKGDKKVVGPEFSELIIVSSDDEEVDAFAEESFLDLTEEEKKATENICAICRKEPEDKNYCHPCNHFGCKDCLTMWKFERLVNYETWTCHGCRGIVTNIDADPFSGAV